MNNADSNVALMRVMSMLALMLCASGCEQPMPASSAGNVDEFPLLVQFDEANKCPIAVIQVIESCDADHQNKDTVCREKGQKIFWVAVAGASLPYRRDGQLPEFGIVFKDKNKDPIESPGGGQCKDSSKGVLDCKIRKDTPTDTYDYSVVAGSCRLDPRIYVP